jgi:hypothetical protein
MVERYTSEEREKEKQKERRGGIPVPVWVIIVGLLVAFVGGIFVYRSFDEQYSEAASLVSRVGDSILATFFGQTPKFIWMWRKTVRTIGCVQVVRLTFRTGMSLS